MYLIARRMLVRLGVVGVTVAVALGVSTAPAYAISDGVIAATDAGDNVGRFIAQMPDGRTRLCTATLIATDKVMTAEHCIWDLNAITDITITFGTKNIGSDLGESARAIDWKRSDRDYRGTRDSIAILTLERPITSVAPARVAEKGASNELYARGKYVLAIGWGTINPDQNIRSRELRFAGMFVADPISTINGGAIRVGELDQGRPQHGDSGGPLFAYDDQGAPIVVGVYTGSGKRAGDQHFYMKTTNEDASFFG